MVDVFAFVALGVQDVGGLFRDADADGKGAPRGGATLGKLVITHWRKPLDRDAVGLNLSLISLLIDANYVYIVIAARVNVEGCDLHVHFCGI